MSEAISVDYKSLRSKKNNTASHKLYKATKSGVYRHIPLSAQGVSETFYTNIFTGYSTRPTSASKAKQVGLSLPEILKSG